MKQNTINKIRKLTLTLITTSVIIVIFIEMFFHTVAIIEVPLVIIFISFTIGLIIFEAYLGFKETSVTTKKIRERVQQINLETECRAKFSKEEDIKKCIKGG